MRNGGDSGVVMMAAVAEDCGGRRQRQRQTMTVADNTACKIEWQTTKGTDKSGRRETVETRSGDDGFRGGRWRRWMTMAADNDNGDGG